MPSGVFKPYAGVSTALLLFTKSKARTSGKVWYYDMQADGYSLDDKRQKIAVDDTKEIVTEYHRYLAEGAAYSFLRRGQEAKYCWWMRTRFAPTNTI